MSTKNSELFRDVRMHDFFRVAVVVPRVHVGNPVANAAAHLDELEKVRAEGAEYALCPELGLTGYSNGDLFHSDALLSGALQSLLFLADATALWQMLCTVGMPLRVEGKLINAAVTFGHGKIFAVTPKSYLPNYREFYERRHFAGAGEVESKAVQIFGSVVPCGADIILALNAHPDVKIHVDVCEDLWVPIPPGTLAALHGATILANLSASNITVGKSQYREQLVIGSSGRNNAVQMYAAAGYGESTTDLAWDGQGLIAERGALLAKTKRFATSGTHVVADVDPRSLASERMRQNSFRENQADHCALFRTVDIDTVFPSRAPRSCFDILQRKIEPHPFVPENPSDLNERCYEVFEIQATSLMRRLESLPPGRRKVAVGVSGGQDSTHALLVACHAMDLMAAPRTDIVGVTMPGFGTTGRTYQNACALIRATGAAFKEVPIRDLAETMFKSIGYKPDPVNPDVTYENIQAWMRMQTLLSITAKDGGIVLGTGDLSELALGWCTYLGDHASHYNPNGGVPKTLISHLIRWSADVTFKNEPALQAVLRDILDTPISPELLPPDASGQIRQKTEDKNGPYELHDFFLYYFVRFGFTPYRIARLALHAFAGVYTLAEIKKWLKVFVERFFRNQFKRSCLPDGPKVGLTCLSPRGDWRMPSDAEADAWLRDVQSIPD